MNSGIQKVLAIGGFILSQSFAFAQSKPNVLIILSDDPENVRKEEQNRQSIIQSASAGER